jgi:putative chitinase
MTPTIEHIAAAGVKLLTAEKWLPGVISACHEFGIDTDRRLAGFLSQCAHESGGFTMLKENLNYRAATLAACWPTRFAELGPDKKPKRDAKGALIPTKVAHAIAGKPEQIAMLVYNGRMGNTTPEEAAKFIGRGLKQMTGKFNYEKCSKALGVDFVSDPDLLLEPEYAARSAAWFWSANDCSKFADAGDQEGLCRRINGGLIGLEDRKRRYLAALAAMNLGVA